MQKPARLRMNRLAQPATTKVDFELFSLAVSAINGCEMCLHAHETAVIAGGLTEDHVLDAVRIAATIQAAAVALEIGATGGGRAGGLTGETRPRITTTRDPCTVAPAICPRSRARRSSRRSTRGSPTASICGPRFRLLTGT
ncbi:MAG: carboxymuconolactone decarboxylase family protein [Aquabacterium sp.]